LNKLLDKNIVLDKEKHEYRLLNQTEKKFTSVTKFIERHFKKFDAQKIARKLVTNHPKYIGRSIESVIKDWDNARQHGTDVHNQIDEWIKNRTNISEAKASRAVDWLNNYKNQLNIDILSEVTLYSSELSIAGTVDILINDKRTGYYDIIDWKTSKRIDTSAYGKRTGISTVTRDVPDCNYYHYSLQLSLYRYLMEKYYGFKINNQYIVQLKDDKALNFKTPYMRDHISAMLKLKY
tara:strand:- start:28243 stop:28950 length:708 start_codon:yes stop_codon:yes gene_type:complete